jgi:hypothetical protein
VDEYVGAAVVRLNEAEALGGVEPFNCAGGHNKPFQCTIDLPPCESRAVVSIFARES